jgi:hypothetical protein
MDCGRLAAVYRLDVEFVMAGASGACAAQGAEDEREHVHYGGEPDCQDQADRTAWAVM